MKRILSIIVAIMVFAGPMAMSQKYNFWITTEGAGLQIMGGPHHRCPPPPPPRHLRYDGHHRKYDKKHYKKMKKREKEMRKARVKYEKARRKYYEERYYRHRHDD